MFTDSTSVIVASGGRADRSLVGDGTGASAVNMFKERRYAAGDRLLADAAARIVQVGVPTGAGSVAEDQVERRCVL
jgi:hypothetical protein